jgi:hypothetical protein
MLTRSPIARKPRARKCAICREPATSSANLKPFCSPGCGLELAKLTLAKQERARDRQRKEQTKSARALKVEAQKAINAFARERDRQAGHGCICCGAVLEWDSGIPGGLVDAGHYVSRGSMPSLALDPRNINAQRKSCNMPGGANRDSFRAGMIDRWGAAVVAELEGPQPVRKYTADDYRCIKDEYRMKLRQLKGKP